MTVRHPRARNSSVRILLTVAAATAAAVLGAPLGAQQTDTAVERAAPTFQVGQWGGRSS